MQKIIKKTGIICSLFLMSGLCFSQSVVSENFESMSDWRNIASEYVKINSER
jgi:hypothetical protein